MTSRLPVRHAHRHILPCLLVIGALALCGWHLPPPCAAAEAGIATLTILHTNDHHAHLLPFDLPGTGKNIGGLARRSALIKQFQRAQPDLLVLDSGDIFQGTPFYTFFKGAVDLVGFDLCRYDATTLGNHELDDGLPNLLEQFKAVKMRMICANVVNASDGTRVFDDRMMIHRGPFHIGVTGAIGSQAWDVIPEKHRATLAWVEPEPVIASIAHDLRRHGAQIVVLLSHHGYEGDLQLAPKTPLVDVIIGGHSNTQVDHPILVANGAANGLGGTLVVQAGKWGAFLGRLDLALELASPTRIATYAGRLHLIDATIDTTSEDAVNRLLTAYNVQMKHLTGQVVGRCPQTLTYAEEEKHLRDLPLGRLVCHAIMDAGRADLAIINSGCIREPLPAGEVTIGQVQSIVPFENTVVTYTLSGQGLVELLDFVAANYGGKTGYQFGGVAATLDVKNGKATNITVGSQPVDLQRMYTLGTISYLADGNQNGRALFKDCTDKRDLGYLIREVVIDYLRRHNPVPVFAGDQLTVRRPE